MAYIDAEVEEGLLSDAEETALAPWLSPAVANDPVALAILLAKANLRGSSETYVNEVGGEHESRERPRAKNGNTSEGSA
jgi:hypothetical protein